MRFRVWYADGSTYDSSDGAWEEAPADGVQVVMLYFEPPYREIITGVDEYRIPGRQHVKSGSLMEPESAYMEIQRQAFNDHEWPEA